MNIQEDFVSFGTAKLLKEKWFDDEYTNAFYDKTGDLYFIDLLSGFSEHPDNDTDVAASTLYVAMKWLREVHNIDIVIEPHLFKEKKATEYRFNYWIDEHYHMPYSESYPVYHPLYAKTWESYEEACEAAIKYCLENLI